MKFCIKVLEYVFSSYLDKIGDIVIKTKYRNPFSRNSLSRIMIDDLDFQFTGNTMRDFSDNSLFNINKTLMLKSSCGSKFILLNGIDLKDMSFGKKLQELKNDEAMMYALNTLIKTDNIVLYLEEVELEDGNKELRYIIFKFKDLNISHVEHIGVLRSMIEGCVNGKELPDFQFLEVHHGIKRISRLLRFKKES